MSVARCCVASSTREPAKIEYSLCSCALLKTFLNRQTEIAHNCVMRLCIMQKTVSNWPHKGVDSQRFDVCRRRQQKQKPREFPFKFAFSAVRIVECLCSNLFIAHTNSGRQLRHSDPQMHWNLSRIPSSRTWNSSAIARNKSADDWQIVLHAILLLLFQDGGRGHLEGLASVYCEILMAPFGEVLMLLEDARRKAWSNRSPKHSAGQGKGYRGSCNQIDTLPNSHSQPLYVPGKYSVRENRDNCRFFCVICSNENFSPPCSHQAVSPIRRRTKFMASVMECSPPGSGGTHYKQIKVSCHCKIHYQIVQPMYLLRNNKGKTKCCRIIDQPMNF